jgi:hypothetical protein
VSLVSQISSASPLFAVRKCSQVMRIGTKNTNEVELVAIIPGYTCSN